MNEKTIVYRDNNGKGYSYTDLMQLTFDQLNSLEKGEDITQNPIQQSLSNSKSQEKGRQKTLGIHPLARKKANKSNNVKSTITTIIMAFCLFLSGLFAIILNLSI